MGHRIRPMPIADFEAELMSLYGPPLSAVATRRMMAQVFAELRALSRPDGRPLLARSSDLTVVLVAAWIRAHPGRSSARSAALLRCVRRMCNYASDSHRLDVSPFRLKPLGSWLRADAVPSRNAGRVYRRSPGEIARLLAHLDAKAGVSWHSRRLQALVYVYVYTAFRKSEALHLLARNVDFAAGVITVEPVPGVWLPKTVRSARSVPMAGALAEVLATWAPMCGGEWLFPGAKNVGPWTGGGPRYNAVDQIAAAAREAGIERITPIYCRKWFGTNAKAMGLGPLEVQSFLGHSNPETQASYDEEAVHSMRPAVKKLELFYGRAPGA